MSDSYALSVCRDYTGRYFVAAAHQGNASKLRVDHFRDGTKRMLLPVTREDWLRNYVPWSYIDPRELTQRYIEHCARERARIAAIYAGSACKGCGAHIGSYHREDCAIAADKHRAHRVWAVPLLLALREPQQ